MVVILEKGGAPVILRLDIVTDATRQARIEFVEQRNSLGVHPNCCRERRSERGHKYNPLQQVPVKMLLRSGNSLSAYSGLQGPWINGPL